MHLGLAFLLLLLTPALTMAAPSVQEVLLRARPAVALVVAEVASEAFVSCPGGPERRVSPPPFRETGTGWFISPGGWMITNAHVVSSAHRPSSWIRERQARRAVREACGDLPAQTLAATASRARVRLEPSIHVVLANGRRLPAAVAKYASPPSEREMSTGDLALLRLELADMPSLPLADSSAAQLGDKLHVLGFPDVVLSHELLGDSAKLDASVTSGVISGFKQDATDQPVIETDAPAAWGNSGGPAVTSNGEVLGVLTFVTTEGGADGDIIQGFNFVIPSAAIRAFLEGMPLNLRDDGRFNRAWHAGLERFFAGDYSGALTHFADADHLLPGLPDVRRMSDQAKNPPPQRFPWNRVAGSVAIASLAGWGVVRVGRWRRNRYRIRPSDVRRLLESPVRPLILDVRDEPTYERSPVRIPGSRHITPRELAAGAVRLEIEPRRVVVAYCT